MADGREVGAPYSLFCGLVSRFGALRTAVRQGSCRCGGASLSADESHRDDAGSREPPRSVAPKVVGRPAVEPRDLRVNGLLLEGRGVAHDASDWIDDRAHSAVRGSREKKP